MPWKESNVLDERVRFVVEALQGHETIATLCRQYEVSRKTGYKWLRRYREEGSLRGLADHSRRPRHSPRTTAPEVVERVVDWRLRTGWGSRALQRLLERDEGIRLGRSTIDRILKREGLQAMVGPRPAPRRFERATPNELVQMDFKGEYTLSDGMICYPLSLLDDHSRFALALSPQRSQHGAGVQAVLAATFSSYGVPQAMLVDHGTPWWSSTNGHGLTRTAIFLIRQGVQLIYSGVGHPQTQGKVERFHGTLARWLRHHGIPSSYSRFAAALADFRQIYNEVRPHESLALQTPASRYQPSWRPYVVKPPAWVYPPGAEVRILAENGCVYLGGRYRFVCHALGGRRVRCDRFADRILVSYRDMLIREIDTTTGSSRAILEPYGPTGHPTS
jgi:transposase InsO family protein